MKRFLSIFFVLILCAGLFAPARTEDAPTYTGTVKGTSLHLRKQPNASAAVINTYKQGTQVTVLENDGTWCKVQIGKKVGYMMAQYLEISANYKHVGWGRTQADGTVLNIRGGAGTTFPILQKALSGGVYELTQELDGWYQVKIGDRFGYIEKTKITVFEGDFALGFSAADNAEAWTMARMNIAPREAGSPLTMTRSEGDFTYSLSYPELGVPAADAKISGWVRSTLRAFEADYQQNHAGQQASFALQYQSLQLDEQYMSVFLYGEYTVGAHTVECVLTVNADAKAGKALDGESLFESLDWPLFCLESAATSLMSVGTDGYSGKPDRSWLQYAALGRDGVQVYLPRGLYLPYDLGTRKLTLKYQQVGEYMKISSAAVTRHIRVIDPGKPMIALTFDDGPSEETERILAVLEEYNARATFCVIGNKVENYVNVVKRTLAGGNEIASHTWNHSKLTSLSAASIRSQLQKTNDLIRELTGYEVKVLRPPYGSVNKNVRSVCAELGMTIALWQVDTEDWETRNANKTYNALKKGAKDGVIVLFHDLYKTTASAVEKAIPELIEKGYQLVTVSELLSFLEEGAKPGAVYTKVSPENRVK
ncbi:MAG: polysaccharide deacetylase family protein [Clostridia bacterium]|nr:polysaccharide deacetylase family protein [Clostridia bacterium]